MMKLLVTCAIAVAALAPLAHARQVFGGGSCPTVTAIAAFKPADYAGVWFEQEKYFAWFEQGATCISATYTATKDPNKLSIINRQYSLLASQYQTITGTAVWTTPTSAEGKLGVSFSGGIGGGEAKYWVLDTDYTSYAVVWSCIDIFGIFNLQNAWILTRLQPFDAAVVGKGEAALTKQSISLTPLSKTNQTGCP